MSVSLLTTLLCTLDMATLERLTPGTFTTLGQVPAWCRQLYPQAFTHTNAFLPQYTSPFLENFLIDADYFWVQRQAGQLPSGPWTDTDAAAQVYHLEAMALCVDQRTILCLQRLGATYDSLRSVLQTAREHRLDYQRLTRAEAALRQSEAKNRALLNAIPDLMLSLARDGTCLDYKVAKENAFGLPDGTIVGQTLSTFWPADLAQQVYQCAEQARHSDTTVSFEAQLTQAKAVCELEVRLAACGAEEVMVMVRDITDRKRAETMQRTLLAHMAQSHDNLLAILDQLDLGTALLDEHGCLTFLSQSCQRFLRQARQTLLGQAWHQALPLTKQDQAQLQALCDAAPDSRRKLRLRLEPAEGRHYWMEIDVQDDPRDVRKKLLLFYDVTAIHDLRHLLATQGQFHDLIGKSEPMLRVFQHIRDIASVDTTVLIEGETGTGKELVARAIHTTSHRKAGAFVAVNCAGLTESLLASQLFGHRRGAFTGAIADQQGLFEAANGGTLFLDEVGDLPLSVQTSLLRVLQEREITRLGEARPRKIDVRILAATHRDLPTAIAQGTFRLDLLYRLRVARLRLPPLRERRQDIPLLVSVFLRQCRALTGKPVEEVSQEAMRLLLDYDWPGNVRELRSAIEFAVICCPGTVLRVEDQVPEIREIYNPRPAPPGGAVDDKRQRLLAALEQAHGNRKDAARLLGISRATLYRHLASLNISPS